MTPAHDTDLDSLRIPPDAEDDPIRDGEIAALYLVAVGEYVAGALQRRDAAGLHMAIDRARQALQVLAYAEDTMAGVTS